jgi:hypothetical protein
MVRVVDMGATLDIPAAAGNEIQPFLTAGGFCLYAQPFFGMMDELVGTRKSI